MCYDEVVNKIKKGGDMHVRNTSSKNQFNVIPQILSYLFLNQLKTETQPRDSISCL